MTKNNFFRLHFFLRKPYADRAEWPLFVRISAGERRIEFKIGRDVAPGSWNQTRCLCKGRSPKAQELNSYLELVRAKLLEIHNRLFREGADIDPMTIKECFLGSDERPKMMCEVFREANEGRREEYEHGDVVKATYQRWTRCADYLEEFFRLRFKSPDVPIKDVTSGMLDDFERFLRTKKSCANNAAVRYMRCVKNVIQYALAHRLTDRDPFAGKKYRRTVVRREFLTEPELRAIMKLDFTALPRLDVVRDTFLFCCFTGLAFCDVRALMWTDISEDASGHVWIRKPRAKTGGLSVIPMLEIPMRIVRKYREHPAVKSAGVALPVITNQKMNAYLKEIADLAGIRKHLTTHVARHTFASISLSNQVSIEVISKILGHSDIKTTQIYAKMQDQAIYDGMAAMRSKFDGDYCAGC